MAPTVYFLQECPTCGRQLRVRKEYHSLKVACQHCGGRFKAHDVDQGGASDLSASESNLIRAEQLLEMSERRGA